MRVHLLFAWIFLASVILGQGVPQVSGGKLIAEQACFDVLSYELELDVRPDVRSIKGALTMRAKAVSATNRIALHLDDRLKVSAVTSGDREVAYTHRRGRIRMKLPKQVPQGAEIQVTVAYGGRPRVAPGPPWDGGFTWSKTKDGRPWIATTCQGEGADLWWPCKDHPSDKAESMDLHITVPKGLVCASNGRLIQASDTDDGRRTFHWKVGVPIANYCVALNIAPFEEIRETYESVTGEEVPVSFFVLPESLDKARKVLPEFLDHVRHMEEVCGPYPFRKEKYGIVESPHLGMEHQTIIAYGNKFRRAQSYDWLHHHEMSHEWWANLVTCRDWKDMWIHEGIGTYMQSLYLEKRRGRKAYEIDMAQKSRHNNQRAVAPRKVQDSKEIYFGPEGGHDNDIYYKGSWIMHTLRWVMGDEKFFVALRRMAYPDPEMEKVTDGSQVRFSDTEEIRAIAEKVHGSDLGWFFEVYLRQPALPELVSKRSGKTLRFAWKSPVKGDFPMPVPVKIGDEIHRVEMDGGKGTFTIPPGAEAEVDPDRLILKKEPRRRRRRRGS